jgi:hypothetical protein
MTLRYPNLNPFAKRSHSELLCAFQNQHEPSENNKLNDIPLSGTVRKQLNTTFSPRQFYNSLEIIK